MKRSILLAVGTALILTLPVVFGDDTHHPDKQKTPIADKQPGTNMGQMQENMLKTHALMHKIQQTKDSQERQKLMQEHMRATQESMTMMQGMMGAGMMGPGDNKGKTMMDKHQP